MNLITSWVPTEWAKALGWTFVHSLWQIALIGLILFVVLRLIPGRSAHTRYTISTLALWMIVVMALSTFIIMLPETQSISEYSGTIILTAAQPSLTLTDKISTWLEVRMPMMLTIWSAGVAFLMIRLAISLAWVKHMRTTATPEADIQQVLDSIISRLRLQVKPTAAQSLHVPSPVTIGHLKPFILFPMGIINQLSPVEVEAILTHELAHIVRKDYLSNLVQSFIETIFYYHPITWWISGMVRSERENRADDLAVRWCGDHLGYAKALVTIQEMQSHQAPSLALGFNSRKGAMLHRIQRILNLPYKNHNQMEKTVLLSLTTLCFMAFTMTSHTPQDQPAEKPAKMYTITTTIEQKRDSIPSVGTFRIHKKTDEQDISVEVENGDIKELKVDGKEIQPSEFEAYNEVIDELFGSIESPPTMQEFNFRMAPMPEMPAMPEMPHMVEGFYFEMPDLPPMPAMPDLPELHELQLEQLMTGEHLIQLHGLPGVSAWSTDGMNNIRVITDSTADGQTRVIVIAGEDSTLIDGQNIEISGNGPIMVYGSHPFPEGTEWRQQQEAYRDQAEQYRKQQQEWREQSREMQDALRKEQNQIRKEYRGQLSWTEDDRQAMERDLALEGNVILRYAPQPRLSLSDQMVSDGLIEPGAEVEVQLTPDKLKINGEKMPESIHQKYLELYEQQQGMELTGNSRVEFTTKSKQRM